MSTDLRVLEAEFHARMRELIRKTRDETGYLATRAAGMIQEMGGLATARALILADHPGEGFTKMAMLRRLDLTVEAEVLLPRWDDLFADEPELRERARRRLAAYDYRPDPPG